jgi:hypothetical protein
MNESQIVNLLWADDDCKQLLNPLSWRFEQNQFRLWERTNYSEAQSVLRLENIDSLLVDIILPFASGVGTLRTNLGIELAGFAAQNGVQCVTFLTVVLREEVDERYKRLERDYPSVKFEYINKLFLLERNTIEKLVESLKPNHA